MEQTRRGASAPSAGERREVKAPVQLTLGGKHSCAWRAGGEAQCWGSNQFGQLGSPSVPTGRSSVRAKPGWVVGLPGSVMGLAAGSWHTCAVLAAGGAFCWGHGGFGQLGQGDLQDSAVPVAVSGLPVPARAVVAGRGHTCVLLVDGSVYCFGRNDLGQLGVGDTQARTMPTRVAGLEGVQSMVAGADFTCAQARGGNVACWGADIDGQLGRGGRPSPGGWADRPAPVRLVGPTSLLVASGGLACVLNERNEWWCWGRNRSHQLPSLTLGSHRNPVLARLPPGSRQLELGSHHACVQVGSRVQCAGANYAGQLGAGSTEEIDGWASVELEAGAEGIALGVEHGCAVGDAQPWCWGNNAEGQVGDGTTETRPTPVPVALLTSK